MRYLTLVVGVLLACAAALPGAAQSLPPIPFLTNYTYWDHHWLQWLPSHPRFEAIEASVASANGRQFIRVWLTERAPPKRQVHYFDDEDMARAMRGGVFAPIHYGVLGEPGAPRGLDLDFHDEGGQEISWFLRFAPEQKL